jgi:hypothetical protein
MSPLAQAGFAAGLAGFLSGLFPFAGLLGTLGLILSVIDLVTRDPPDRPRRHGLAIAGAAFGGLATAGVVVWVVIFASAAQSASRSSCPHVYAYDGEDYQLDADLVSGALYPGAVRTDTDRLEHLVAVDGEYRLRIQDDLEEVDHVDRLSLLLVDHAAGAEVLPTQGGELWAVEGAAAPLRAVDAAGRDVRPELAVADGRAVQGAADAPRTAGGDPREAWTLTFARPATARALLVLRGNSTPFAEEAFATYLAQMGQGVGPLMEWMFADDCPCTRAHVEDEMNRMGMPLTVAVSTGGAWTPAASLVPVGPAVSRSQVVLIELPAGGGETVTLRLGATPRFWSLDQVALAPAPGGPVTPREILPGAARTAAGVDVTGLLAEGDGREVVLSPGERVDVRFAAPPVESGRTRTAIVSMRGWYQMGVGGRKGLDPAAIAAHQLGLTSLPRFAAGRGGR